MGASFPVLLGGTLDTLYSFLASNPMQRYACFLLLALCLCCVTLSVRKGGRGGALLAVGALLGLGLCVALLGYLAWQGRLPMRAGISALFPSAAFLYCLFFFCAGPASTARDRSPKRTPAFLWAVVAVCLALSAGAGIQTARALNPPSDSEQEERAVIPVDLDAYALENPGVLIICDLSLTGDNRLFPDTAEGIPGNVMFWGGYPARSPSWLRQLAQYGIDGAAFTPLDFLRENVVLASTDGQPWESLITYIDESSEDGVEWEFYDEAGYIGFFQVCEE
jgi:hypothetical protein